MRTITGDRLRGATLDQPTPTSDPDECENTGNSEGTALAEYHALIHLREVHQQGILLNETPEQRALYKRIWLATEPCKCRKLATLHRYPLALALLHTREGDRVCILQGSGVPWVLRPCAAEVATYEVVGQCFVDGNMYGEGVDRGEEGKEGKEMGDTLVLV